MHIHITDLSPAQLSQQVKMEKYTHFYSFSLIYIKSDRKTSVWIKVTGLQFSLVTFRDTADDITVHVQDIINTLEERLKPLVNAELSVLVDVLHQPELLFLEGTDARQRCESGGFISK